jgi:signal transduction histidine kinase
VWPLDLAVALLLIVTIGVPLLLLRSRRRCRARTATLVASLAVSEERYRRVAEMQGALRRVATLVARGVSPQDVFSAVAEEAGRVLGVDHTAVARFEPDETVRVVAYWSHHRAPQVMPPLEGSWPIEEGTVTAAVRATERPARMTDYQGNTSAIGTWARSQGVRCVVGCPVKVEGRLWGALFMHSRETVPAPGRTEDRMREFVELAGAAIANAQSRSDLLASRARVVAAADESRRRIERDLHDGAQQRLVALALRLRTIQSGSDGPARLRERIGEAVGDLTDILHDLQEVSRGIIPPILTRSGLPPVLRSLARRAPVPVRLRMSGVDGRLPRGVEVAVYYTVCEAFTNVVKHAEASTVCVDLALRHGRVHLSVRDDGRGGADLSLGTGLVGLKDRVEALGGHIEVRSPPDGGTSVRVEIPAGLEPDPAADASPL